MRIFKIRTVGDTEWTDITQHNNQAIPSLVAQYGENISLSSGTILEVYNHFDHEFLIDKDGMCLSKRIIPKIDICPWCKLDGTIIEYQQLTGIRFSIGCTNAALCWVCPSFFHFDPKKGIEIWNERKDS